MDEKVIKESSLEEFEEWIIEYQKNRYIPYFVDVLDFFNESYKDIKEEQKKLNHIFTIWGYRIGERRPTVLSGACSHLHEYIVEQLLLRGWDPNNSYNDTVLHKPIRETIMPDDIFIEKEKVKVKQKKILLLLIQYGLSLDFMKKDSFGKNVNEFIQLNESQHIYDWIGSLSENFNDKQRKEWKMIRLQQLF